MATIVLIRRVIVLDAEEGHGHPILNTLIHGREVRNGVLNVIVVSGALHAKDSVHPGNDLGVRCQGIENRLELGKGVFACEIAAVRNRQVRHLHLVFRAECLKVSFVNGRNRRAARGDVRHHAFRDVVDYRLASVGGVAAQALIEAGEDFIRLGERAELIQDAQRFGVGEVVCAGYVAKALLEHGREAVPDVGDCHAGDAHSERHVIDLLVNLVVVSVRYHDGALRAKEPHVEDHGNEREVEVDYSSSAYQALERDHDDADHEAGKNERREASVVADHGNRVEDVGKQFPVTHRIDVENHGLAACLIRSGIGVGGRPSPTVHGDLDLVHSRQSGLQLLVELCQRDVVLGVLLIVLIDRLLGLIQFLDNVLGVRRLAVGDSLSSRLDGGCQLLIGHIQRQRLGDVLSLASRERRTRLRNQLNHGEGTRREVLKNRLFVVGRRVSLVHSELGDQANGITFPVEVPQNQGAKALERQCLLIVDLRAVAVRDGGAAVDGLIGAAFNQIDKRHLRVNPLEAVLVALGVVAVRCGGRGDNHGAGDGLNQLVLFLSRADGATNPIDGIVLRELLVDEVARDLLGGFFVLLRRDDVRGLAFFLRARAEEVREVAVDRRGQLRGSSLDGRGGARLVHEPLRHLATVAQRGVKFLNLGLQGVDQLLARRAGHIQRQLEGVALGVGGHGAEEGNELIGVDKRERTAEEADAAATGAHRGRLEVHQPRANDGASDVGRAAAHHAASGRFKGAGVADVRHVVEDAVELVLQASLGHGDLYAHQAQSHRQGGGPKFPLFHDVLLAVRKGFGIQYAARLCAVQKRQKVLRRDVVVGVSKLRMGLFREVLNVLHVGLGTPELCRILRGSLEKLGDLFAQVLLQFGIGDGLGLLVFLFGDPTRATRHHHESAFELGPRDDALSQGVKVAFLVYEEDGGRGGDAKLRGMTRVLAGVRELAALQDAAVDADCEHIEAVVVFHEAHDGGLRLAVLAVRAVEEKDARLLGYGLQNIVQTIRLSPVCHLRTKGRQRAAEVFIQKLVAYGHALGHVRKLVGAVYGEALKQKVGFDVLFRGIRPRLVLVVFQRLAHPLC